MNPRVGVQVPPGLRHLLSKKFRQFLKDIRLWVKRNVVTYEQLTFQMLQLETKIHIYRQSQCSETWNENVWPQYLK